MTAFAPTVEPSPMPKQQRNDEAVRIGAEVARKARLVAASRGLTLGQYVTAALDSVVSVDYRQLAESMAAEVGPPKSKPRK